MANAAVSWSVPTFTQPAFGGQVVDPVRDHLPVPRAGEVVVADPHRVAGGPPGPARAGVLADLLLLLGIHADHRVPGCQVGAGLLVDVPELAVPVRVLLPLDRLGVGLQAEPLRAEQLVHRVRATPGVPGGASSPASVRTDLPVHRSGDSGSPRSSGLTSASSAGTSPGSVWGSGLRPPPGRRARPSGSCPDSSSRAPSDTVPSRTPAAAATSRIPPWPSARASAPSSSRRCRSSRCGKMLPNFAASISRVTVKSPITHSMPEPAESTAYLLTRPNRHVVTWVWLFSSECHAASSRPCW